MSTFYHGDRTVGCYDNGSVQGLHSASHVPLNGLTENALSHGSSRVPNSLPSPLRVASAVNHLGSHKSHHSVDQVNRADRLQQIVSIVSEAARQSLKKKGMHIPPWRKAEYMRAKWLSPHTRTTTTTATAPPPNDDTDTPTENIPCLATTDSDCGELELIFGEKTSSFSSSSVDFSVTESSSPVTTSGKEKKPMAVAVASTWQPPAIKPKSCERGAKIVTGLASLLRERP